MAAPLSRVVGTLFLARFLPREPLRSRNMVAQACRDRLERPGLAERRVWDVRPIGSPYKKPRQVALQRIVSIVERATINYNMTPIVKGIGYVFLCTVRVAVGLVHALPVPRLSHILFLKKI